PAGGHRGLSRGHARLPREAPGQVHRQVGHPAPPARIRITMSKNDLVILSGARTAMAEYVGTPGYGKLADRSALELGAIAGKAALERSGVKPEQVDHAVFGMVLYTSQDALYGARHIGLKAGLPIATPALTVNRLCGSGIQSVISAAHLI